ncbi:DUF3489 domain-containing protein [Roseibium sp.]|uniref:DUF3489 domain-containing protein n=1 Tax=Roseibium sp. TaxID=1936156 RepID=UPI00329A5BD5
MIDTNETKPTTTRPRRMARDLKSEVGIEMSGSPLTPNVEPEPAKPSNKSSLVLEMLQRPEGATIAQIVTATSWLPHTTRAALTGLKKKGHEITSEKVEGEERVYRTAAV